MIVERTDKEILIRLSNDFDSDELQNIIDFLKFKEISSKSKASQDEIDLLSKSVNKRIWKKFNEESSTT